MQRHKARLLCDPAKKVLDALAARGQSFDLPEVELVEPLPMDALSGPGDTRIMRQLVVEAATTVVVGVARPALVITGRDFAGPLPRWLYVSDDEGLLRATEMFVAMARTAIRRAADLRG